MKELTLEDVADALDHLDYESREVWVQMGMAIKTEFGDDGWRVWDGWSKKSSVYDESAAKASWKSFRKGGIGIGTLLQAAKAAGWEYNPGELDAEERQRRREAADRRRRELAAEIEADEQARAEWHERVAAASLEIDRLLEWGGKSAYLERKKVRPFGVKFVPNGFLVITHIKALRIELITGKDAVTAFFGKQKRGEIDRETVSFRYVRFGTIAVPMRDAAGKLWGWQFIPEKGDKQFLKFGRKSGLFHFIAEHEGSYQKRPALAGHLFSSPPAAIAQVEGYATGASIHQATQYPVAVAFDAGNMPHVARALRAAFPDTPLLMCGDNDRDTDGNPGLTKATEAAEAVQGIPVVPDFTPYEIVQEDAA